MAQRPGDEPAVRSGLRVSRLEAGARRVFALIDEGARCRPLFDVGLDRLEEFEELTLVVEGSHDHVPSLMAFWVEPIVANDEPSDAVVLDVDPGHGYTLSGPARHRICHRTHLPQMA